MLAALARGGRWNAMTRPALVSINSRREGVELMGSPELGARCAVRGCMEGARYAVRGCLRCTECSPLTGGNRAPRTRFLCQFSNRQLSDPLSVQGEDRVAHGRGDRGRAGLSDAALRVGRRHDVHLDPGHVAHAEHEVLMEVALLGAA